MRRLVRYGFTMPSTLSLLQRLTARVLGVGSSRTKDGFAWRCMPGAPLVFAALLAGPAATLEAHPEGFSGLHVVVTADRIRASATLHTRDLSQWFPPRKYPDYSAGVCGELRSNPQDVFELQLNDEPLRPEAVRSFSPEVGMVELDVDYRRPAEDGELRIWSKDLYRLPGGHQQLLVVDDARTTPPTNMLQATLAAEEDSATVELSGGAPVTSAPSTRLNVQRSPAPKRTSFFALGIEHIVTGYDHLLFLGALLLVCRSFREAAGVITFFTIAHSITLTLATLDVVRLPGRIVEPAIAASIVYVGLENIFGRHRFAWRAGVTFAFGLVHGLGFAAALREVGLGSTAVGIAWPLVKFSAGLETGQLLIAAILLRVLLTARKRPGYERRWMPLGSLLVSLIGAYWLVTRLVATG